MKDEARSHLKDEENDFMHDNSYGDETLEELTAVKAIAAQPKMYHAEMLHSTNLKIDSPESEETLEDTEESRLKMRNKMVQLDYGKLNALYEAFIPQQESSVEQTYFSIPFTFNNYSESNEVPDSMVKRALFTTLIAAKSKILGAISVVMKSRLSVVKTPTVTNKKFMGTVRLGNDHFAAINGYGDFIQDSSDDMNEIPSQQDLDNLFGPMYEKYYAPSTSKVSKDSAANTLNDEDPSPSSIIVEDNDASQIITSSDEPIIQDSSNLALENHSDEQIQKDVATLNGNTIMHSFETHEFEEA
nr:hypothetical protein [Tanacetum cinerariifolium]